MTFKSSLLAVTSAFLLTTSAVASQKGLFKSGAYLGVSFGYSRLNSKVNDSMSAPGEVTYSRTGRSSSNAVVGGIDVGYRHLLNNGFLIGLEAGLHRDNNKITKNYKFSPTYSTTTTIRSSYIITPAVVFGKTLNNRWLAFAKLGMSLRRFTSTHSNVTSISTKKDKFTTRKTGFLAAVGAEYAFSEKISALGSISYERFGNINHTNAAVRGGAGEKNEVTMKPSYITAKVGIIYKF